MDNTPYIFDRKLEFITCRDIVQTLTHSKKNKVTFSKTEDIAFVSCRGLLRALLNPVMVQVYWYEPCLYHLNNDKPNYYSYIFPNRTIGFNLAGANRYIGCYINRVNQPNNPIQIGFLIILLNWIGFP